MEGTVRPESDSDIVTFFKGMQRQWQENIARHVNGLQRHLPHFPLPTVPPQARADLATADGAERPPGLREVGVRVTGGARSGGGQGGGAEGNDSRRGKDGAEGRRDDAGAPAAAFAQAEQAETRGELRTGARKWGRETVKQRLERWRRERDAMRRAGNAAAEAAESESDSDSEDDGEGARRVTVEELYVARSNHYTPNVLTFGYSFKQWTEYWALLSTGELYLGLPHGDPRHFDFLQDRRTNPHRFVPLRHEHGPSHEFEYDGSAVALAAGQQEVRVGSGGTVFRRVQPCEAEEGCRLEGRFVHEAARDFVDAAEASGVHGVTAISFRSDGTFRVRGGTGILPCVTGEKGEGGGMGGGMGAGMGVGGIVGAGAKGGEWEEDDEDKGGRGQYEIRGTGIELRYEGGRVEDAFFFEYPGTEGMEVNINGTTYHRVEEEGGQD